MKIFLILKIMLLMLSFHLFWTLFKKVEDVVFDIDLITYTQNRIFSSFFKLDKVFFLTQPTGRTRFLHPVSLFSSRSKLQRRSRFKRCQFQKPVLMELRGRTRLDIFSRSIDFSFVQPFCRDFLQFFFAS